jgi:Ca2+-binding RTX toxin-like protein
MYVQGTNGITLREFDGATGNLLDGPDPGVDGVTSSLTFISDAAGLTAGGSFMLYQDDDAGDSVMRGRLFDVDNQPLDGHFDVAKIAGKDITGGRTDQLVSGNIAATFTVADQSETGDIYAKLLSSDGDTEKDIFQINQKTEGRQYGSRVAALDSGGFAVAWVDHDQNQSEGVKARVFDADGNAVSAEFNVDQPSKGDQNGISITAISGGRFAVLWHEEKSGGQIWAQLYDREGGRIGAEALITKGSSPNYFDQSPHAIEVKNGTLLVGWTRDVKQEGILVQRFDVGAAGTNGDDALNSRLLGRFLDGLEGNDKLTGGKTRDELNGGLGADAMTGGKGNDLFVFADASDSGHAATSRDEIKDFGNGKDKIDLGAVDAVAGDEDNAFIFIGKAKFHEIEGELRVTAGKKFTLIEADIDGDGAADFQIELDGRHSLSAKDFML